MARPKVFDYDPASDETIVTEGAEGHELTWLGFRMNGDRCIHIVVNYGTLNVGGDGIESVTVPQIQFDITDDGLEGRDVQGNVVTDPSTTVVSWYTANKSALDDIVSAALQTVADALAKTGSVIST